MRWEDIKAGDLVAGDQYSFVETTVVNGQVEAMVLLHSKTMQPLLIKRSDYSGLKLLQQEKPKTEKRWKVSGTACGFEIKPDYYDDGFKARDAAGGDPGLTATEVSVVLDGNGKFLQEVA